MMSYENALVRRRRRRKKTAAGTVFLIKKNERNTVTRILSVLFVLKDIFMCHHAKVITKNIHFISIFTEKKRRN
jgi:hypothetical protein